MNNIIIDVELLDEELKYNLIRILVVAAGTIGVMIMLRTEDRIQQLITMIIFIVFIIFFNITVFFKPLKRNGKKLRVLQRQISEDYSELLRR